MGSTAEVKVFYGYAWQEHSEDGHGDFAEGNVCEGRESDWAKVIAVRRGAVNFGWHGHIDYSAWHLAIADTIRSGEWTEAIDLSTLPPVDPAWREQLDRWLTEFNIPAPQDAPRWWAVVRYG